MLNHVKRSLYTAIALALLLHVSVALGARGTGRAEAHEARRGHHAKANRKTRHKPGAVVHRSRSRSVAAATTVLLGDTTVEWQWDLLVAGEAEAFRLRADSSGVAGATSVYVDSRTSARTLIVGLYSSVSGRPGTLLSTGSTPPDLGAWTSVSITPVELVRGRSYWLAILGRGGTLRYRDRDRGPCPSETSARRDLRSLPSSWTTGITYSDCPVSAYVTPLAPLLLAGGPGLGSPLNDAATLLADPALPATPAVTGLPIVSGDTTEGQTLTASEGTWSGGPTSYAYQWEDCDSPGGGCSAIGGATSSTYKLVAGDVGHAVRVVVTASNARGSATANSQATSAVVPRAPTNMALPVTSGTVQEGQTLSASKGSWTGSPTSYSYRWEDCNGSGEACAEIGGAKSSSYKLRAGDVGHTLRVVVTATNAGGSTQASSEATAAVANAQAPANTALPSVSGTAEEGQTLSTSNGSWTGSPTSYGYQWEDCNTSGASCAEIGGARSSSYKLLVGDVGHTLRVVVTATNADGSTKASSEATGTVVTAVAPPANTALPSVSGTAEEGQTLSASNGSWTGSPTSYSYRWEDCNGSGEACAEIGGAKSSSYKLRVGDVGHTLRVVVTATNVGGSTKASSEATGTVVTAGSAGPQIFVSQAGAGDQTGAGSCSDAHSLSWLNSESNWGSGAGKVIPGTTVDLCGTFTEEVDTRGSGSSGEPVTIFFTSGAKIAIGGSGCPGSGCINVSNGSEYVTIDGGVDGAIENTERSYASEKEQGPSTTGVMANGCRHCSIENLDIGPLYIAEKGDVVGNTEIRGIDSDPEGGSPEYIAVENDVFHDMGWAVNIQAAETTSHIDVEYNTFYHLTHGFTPGSNFNGGNVGPIVFAHNRFYGNSNWEDGAADTNHVDGVHCFGGHEKTAHYTGLYIYDNYITTEGANTTGPIFLEGTNSDTPCSDKTSNVWIFDNVLTGNTCCGLAGAFTGEVHTYNNTMIGEGPSSEQGEKETCETWNSDTKEGRPLTVANRSFKNNVVSSCHDLISAERFLAAPNGIEHNLWANASGGNEVFACEHGEVETGGEDKEAFRSSEFGFWVTCMEQPETESRYVTAAKLRLAGQAQAPLGEPESGSEALGHGKNLSSLCSQTPEEALCVNINGEARPSSGPWNIGAY